MINKKIKFNFLTKKMITKLKVRKYIFNNNKNNNTIPNLQINNIFLHQPQPSLNSRKKISITSPNTCNGNNNNIIKQKVNSTLTMFPSDKNKNNLKLLKNNSVKKKYTSAISSTNINSFQQRMTNKNYLSNHYSFNCHYLHPRTRPDLSLYTVLALNKHKLYNKKDNEKNIIYIDMNMRNNSNTIENTKKINNNVFLANKAYIKECYEKNKNRKFFRAKKEIGKYISSIHKDFINSEKIRFYNMMERLSRIKLFIESNPDNEIEVLKKCLINMGIFNKSYFSENKLNNFLKFIKSESFAVDPSKNLKENIINILNNDNILKENNSSVSSIDKDLSNHIKSVIQMYKTLYRNKSLVCKTLDKFKVNRDDLNIGFNIKKQKIILGKRNKVDLIKYPDKIMNEIENKFKDRKVDIINNKTFSNSYWIRNLKKFNSNYNLNEVIDYDMNELKRKNLLTEYACLMKAKDNYDLLQVKLKYNV